MDILQNDIRDMLCQATKKGRGLAVVDLARKFMAARDELCGEGKGHLWSPALSYTLK